MIIINNVNLPLDTDFSKLSGVCTKELKTDISNISYVSLYKKSVDARKKDNVHFCCSLLVGVLGKEEKYLKNNKNASIFSKKEYVWGKCQTEPKIRPIVVGFGPAGMFCALYLARAGLKPIVIERGFDVDTRTKDVENFFGSGKLKINSNIQFGEGGAGTFSDGKLSTGIKDTRIRTVLETFAQFGANKNILTDAKPHIGTDILKNVVKNIRNEIIALGGEIRFGAKLDNLYFENNSLTEIGVNGEKIKCENLVLCIGHSARDTYEMLKNIGINMEQKPFAVGVRIEHLQSDINKALYGDFYESKYLGAADYKMAVHLENGRGVYTFCMCPGGEVINASSEENKIAVNGMSNSARDGKNANSALLVGVNTEDFGSDDVLAGCELQRKIEENAYAVGNGKVPINTVGNFCFGKEQKLGKVIPTVKPDYVFANFDKIFPSFVTNSLKEGIKLMDRKIKGFADFDAVLTAPETRSSSPVRILRDEKGESSNKKGIYPCGEGAGYAGGITSAAVDGLKIAENLLEEYNGNVV